MKFRKEGLLWIPKEEKPANPSVAPRPHWTALIAAYIGPIVSTAALLVSLESFRVAERALQVNVGTTQILNQAQLVIENGYVHFLPSVMPPRRGDLQRVLTIGYVLENAGNSFAEIRSLTFSTEYPKRWAAYNSTSEFDRTSIVPGKTKLEKKYILMVHTDFPFDVNGPIIDKRIGIRITARLLYTDVFGDKEKNWCWGNSIYDFPLDCKDVILDY